MVSEETALKIFPVWLASVLNSMWRAKDPIVVGGSFIPYVLGYLTWYNDIDIFLAASYFPKFLSLFKDETKNFEHLTRTPTQSDYPDSFHVYTVWVGSRATNIQVCHFSKSDLYQLNQLNR